MNVRRHTEEIRAIRDRLTRIGLLLIIAVVSLQASGLEPACTEGDLHATGTQLLRCTDGRWMFVRRPDRHLHHPRLLAASLLVLAAAKSADIYTSRGGIETNALYQGPGGRFDTGRAVGINIGLFGAVTAGEWLIGRRVHWLESSFAYGNFAWALQESGAAYWNAGQPIGQPQPIAPIIGGRDR